MSVRESLRIVFMRDTLRRCVKIALVVGTIFTLLNQAQPIVDGTATAATWIKLCLNYCVPFVVSNLGVLAAKRAEVERERESLDSAPADK